MAIYLDKEQDQNVIDYDKSMKQKNSIPHRVVLEIEVDAETPLEAAKTVQGWLKTGNFQYYVQPCNKSKNVFSVDLDEPDEEAVQETDNYIPMID